MNANCEILKKIAQHLMLSSSFANTIGLLNGKMGCVIFFFNLAEYSKKSVYEKFAYELLEEIYEEISSETQVGFKDGLSGIAWGIDYLICNKSVDIDDEALLDELDEFVVKTMINKIQGTSVEMELKGLAHYVISRKSNAVLNHSMISTDYVKNLANALRQFNQDEETILLMHKLCLVIEDILPRYEHVNLLREIVSNVVFDTDQIFYPQRTLGIINNGYTGIGLNLLWNN